MVGNLGLLLALTPLTHEASPLALGLGNEQIVQSENTCGTFCLSAANPLFDVKASAHAAMAVIPQQKGTATDGLVLSPTKISTYDINWHPFFDLSAAAGWRTSSRSTERSVAAKTTRRITASTSEIPVTMAAKPAEGFSIGGRYVFRSVELKQENFTNSTLKTDAMSAQPNRWGIDAIWQKDDLTGFGISYLSPTLVAMKAKNGQASATNSTAALPQWTDPQEFTASLARLSTIQPPAGVVFGPFENVFHGALSVVTWETGKPVSYSALASSAVSKDGWNLTDTGSKSEEFRFDPLDPSVSVSAGLESLWARTSIGSVSTYTHIRMNHIATKKELNQWQGGFGLGFNSRFLALQASALWREKESGYAVGVSSSL